MALHPQSFSEARDRSLVVLLHAFRHTPARLDAVARVVRQNKTAAHIVVPSLPLSMWSRADLTDVAVEVVNLIDQQVQHRESKAWLPFDEIILVGHSTGSMISRKAYIILCGEATAAPFEHRDPSHTPEQRPRKPWSQQVKRIVQLSGMNGGWSVSHHMGLRRSLEFSVGSAIAHLVLSLTGRRLAIDHIRLGAPFLTELRLQWLGMEERAGNEGRTLATVVQLLGTVDDLVSPDDNLDLVTGREFVYLDVPRSGHIDLIKMDDPVDGEDRRKKFTFALTAPIEDLRKKSVVPSDPDLVARGSPHFTDVVFVVHGIRDTGFWTHKIARRVQAEGLKCHPARKYATETSTYGYFPMLSFLLPWRRRAKVAWLMERYVRALALYPGAQRFSYIGHSNGTYLLAHALHENPACRFDHVVFAGSVVRTDYDWKRAVGRGQVTAVLNYVATNDKVVACFPGAFERLRLQDVGGAGHLGFRQANVKPPDPHLAEVRFVEGGHGAALAEQYWDDIATFVASGEMPRYPNLGGQRRSAVLVGRYPWTVWILMLSALSSLTWAIWQIPDKGLRVVSLIVFWWMILKILTQF